MAGNSTAVAPQSEALFQMAGDRSSPGHHERKVQATVVFETRGMNGLVEVVVLASRIGMTFQSLEAVHDRVVLRAVETRRRVERLVAVSRQSLGIVTADIESQYPVMSE